MQDKIKAFIKSERFGELARYVIIGACTTLVNYVVYYIMARPVAAMLFDMPDGINVLWVNVSSVVAWIFSVAFAFVANKLWVFRARESDRNTLFKEIGAFLAARLFSLAFELAFLSLLVWLGVNDLIAKLICNVFIVLINYFFSKWIFRKKA